MFPFLFEAGPLRIQSYGLFVALGYVAALLLSRRQARSAGFDPAPFSDASFLALLFGLFGGRLLFVLTNLSYFRERPAEVFHFWSGGVVFFGGFLLALPACALYLRRRSLPLLASLDVLAPALALGHAIGRLGCFAAGCCHGSHCPYPWGVTPRPELVEPGLRGLPLHPTQLYESAGLLALTAALLFAARKKPPPGRVAAFYLVGYASLRILVELFRGDSLRGTVVAGISTSQAIAAVLLCGGLALLGRGFRGVRGNH